MTREIQVGAIFPVGKMDPDPVALDGFATGIESAGYRHVAIFDHVLGADRASRPEWTGAYDAEDEFHEPLITLTHIAARTQLELLTCILVLPQRQTALVAKQAATLDLLSEGRLRLGVGLGWNRVEYDALGMPFDGRAKRMEDQIGLLRALWTEHVVSWDSPHHRVDRAGINPRPAQRPIPLWIGTLGRARAPLERIGRVADGWIITGMEPDEDLARIKDTVDRAAREAGRDPASIGFEGRVRVRPEDDVATMPARVQAWEDAGATHVTIETRRLDLRNQHHTELLAEIAAVLELEARPWGVG